MRDGRLLRLCRYPEPEFRPGARCKRILSILLLCQRVGRTDSKSVAHLRTDPCQINKTSETTKTDRVRRAGRCPLESISETTERFANAEPVPASHSRSCPEARSHVDFVRVAHFAQDDTQWHRAPGRQFCKGLLWERVACEARRVMPVAS